MLSTVHINEVLLLSEKMLIHEGFQKTVDSFMSYSSMYRLLSQY